MEGSGLLTYIVLLVAIFYFLLYRPQQKQRRQREELITSLEVGKDVVTIGGIHGEVTEIGDDTVTLKIAENVQVVFQKTAVAFIRNEEEEPLEAAEDEDTAEDQQSALTAGPVSGGETDGEREAVEEDKRGAVEEDKG